MSARNSVRPRALSDVGGFDVETDVLVVGFGAAGAAAAIGAARSGAQVLVVDRAGGPGGVAAMSGGELYLGGGTPIQAACGFHDTPDAMAAFLTVALGPGADETKIAHYSERSVEHFHWLVDCGVPFKPSLWDAPAWVPPTDDGLMWLGENSAPFTDLAAPAPRGHRPAANDFGGVLLMDTLAAAATSAGATAQYDTLVDTLIVDRERVVGVVARRYGQEITVGARRGVILTTGGFVDNDEMLAAHAPRLLGHKKVSAGADDGRGIAIAIAVGAAVRHMSAGQVGMSLIPGLAARGILTNHRGQRFINEDTYPGRIGQAALFTQDMKVWVVVDEQGFDEVPERERWGVQPHHVAESAAELEQLLTMPPGALVDTVRRYNDNAARGVDPEYGKAARWLRPLVPPLAAIDVTAGVRPPSESSGTRRGTGASVFTLGGLHTGVDGHVLDLDGEAIPGLFAAGRASSGLHGWGYISGTSLGDGTLFGRNAGQAAGEGARPPTGER